MSNKHPQLPITSFFELRGTILLTGFTVGTLGKIIWQCWPHRSSSIYSIETSPLARYGQQNLWLFDERIETYGPKRLMIYIYKLLVPTTLEYDDASDKMILHHGSFLTSGCFIFAYLPKYTPQTFRLPGHHTRCCCCSIASRGWEIFFHIFWIVLYLH